MLQKYPVYPLLDRDSSCVEYFPKGVVVFDRDDTLIEDAGQHNEIDCIKFLPGVVDAIKILSDLDYGLAVATNQAGLESGIFSLDKLNEFNNALRVHLKEQIGVEVDLFAVCPHLASTNCNCRKPRIGLLQAIEDSGLGRIKLFVGNSESDRMAAVNFKVDFIHTDGTNLARRIKDWLGEKCV
jgi:D-glycero-D-manno-heptose 1,7-bisphosphate phosphatase